MAGVSTRATEAIIGHISDDAKGLADLMQKVLDTTVAVFESYSIPIPDRKYFTFGDAAIDCEQIVVSFIQLYIGTPGDEATQPQPCSAPRTAVLRVQIARQYPSLMSNGKAPTDESLQTYTVLAACDAWALMESVRDFDSWTDDFGRPLGNTGVIATVEGATPEGGYMATNMLLTLMVP